MGILLQVRTWPKGVNRFLAPHNPLTSILCTSLISFYPGFLISQSNWLGDAGGSHNSRSQNWIQVHGPLRTSLVRQPLPQQNDWGPPNANQAEVLLAECVWAAGVSSLVPSSVVLTNSDHILPSRSAEGQLSKMQS